MSRPCTICSNRLHFSINKDLLAGQRVSEVAAHYKLVRITVQRHVDRCINGGMSAKAVGQQNTHAAIALANLPSREELGGSYQALTTRIDSIVAAAEKQGSLAVAIAGLNSIRQNLDSLSRLAGHDTPAVAVQINNAPMDTSVFVAALAAALPDAEARLRFAQAMATRTIDAPLPVPPSAPVLELSDAN